MPSALFDDSAPSARLVPPGAQAAPTHARAPPEQLGSLRWPPQPASGRPKVDESPFHGQVAYHRQSFLIISHHPLLFIGAGFSGFFVNITSFLLVKRTSSMTFKLLTMMRNGGLVLASGLFFGETIELVRRDHASDRTLRPLAQAPTNACLCLWSRSVQRGAAARPASEARGV